MKATIDLPAELLREMKLRAVHQRRKLKDIAEEALRRGLSTPETPASPTGRTRVKLPIVSAPPNAPKFELGGDRVHELEMEAETHGHDSSLRR